MSDPEGPPDLIAQIDQAVEGTKQVARLVGAYYGNLLAEDVPADDAGALALGYQEWLLENQSDDE